MRSEGEVLLVSCYELGRQPLGVALPAAFLRRAGFHPRVLDLSVERLDEEAVRRARLVVFSVPMHTALRVGVRASHRVRALNPDAAICFVGHYAVLNAEHLLERHGDFVLAGEADEELVALAEARAAGRDFPASTTVRKRLDFPVPARASLPVLDRYARLSTGGGTRLAGAVESTRGCLHTCRHCPISPVYEGRFFAIPREVVLADVAQQVEQGATHITFADPDFLNGPRHAIELSRELHARWPELTFDATIKVEHVLKRRELFPELAANGLLFIVSAFESLNDQVLGELDKGHTGAQLAEAVRIVRDAGIAIRPTFVAFSPWETIESRLELFDFVAREGLVESVDPVQFTLRLLLPPKSLLVERDAMRPHLRGFEPAAFGWKWEHPDARMEELAEESAALVREAIAAGEEHAETFLRLWEQTRRLGGAPERVLPKIARVGQPRVPHLTEAWYC